MQVKFMTAKEAAQVIESGSTIATSGFVGLGNPEELEVELQNRFIAEGEPKNMTLYFAAGQGTGTDKFGPNHFGEKGMLKRIVAGHWNLVPRLKQLVLDNEVEAYNFPQGVISHMYRDAAAGLPGTISKVGLGTFVETCGGKLNEITEEDLVTKVNLAGEDVLFYSAPKLDYVLIKGTYADQNGNVTLEEEGCILDVTEMAIAAKANHGKVIVQVKDIVEAGTLDPKLVKLAGTMVDIVVKTSDVEKYHKALSDNPSQVFAECFSGQQRAVLAEAKPPKFDMKKVIGRIGATMMKPGMVVNLGIGIPEKVAAVLNEEGQGDKMTLTVESGIQGGVPAGGDMFGQSYNPDMIMEMDSQFDFYNGGCLDITFLGLAQCDKHGNVNVSKFGKSLPGCGGFIDISQNTKKVVFCALFEAKAKERIEDGKLIIEEPGISKFVDEVEQITFSADYANKTGQEVMYITERAIFKLTDDGLMLTEYAPGVDVQKDIIDRLPFEPKVSPDLKVMDEALFKPEKMGLKL